jgi:hypothetical protein
MAKSVTDVVLDREQILGLLSEVAVRLEKNRGRQTVLVVVGGSFMTLHGLRSSTADVDTVTRLDAGIRRAVEAVAAVHDLAPDWLNDHAAGFLPMGLDVKDCETMFETQALLVVCPPHDLVFLMKLFANRPSDNDDMIALWPSCSFLSAEVAVEQFYAAYPHLERDPYLAEYLVAIAAAAL